MFFEVLHFRPIPSLLQLSRWCNSNISHCHPWLGKRASGQWTWDQVHWWLTHPPRQACLRLCKMTPSPRLLWIPVHRHLILTLMDPCSTWILRTLKKIYLPVIRLVLLLLIFRDLGTLSMWVATRMIWRSVPLQLRRATLIMMVNPLRRSNLRVVRFLLALNNAVLFFSVFFLLLSFLVVKVSKVKSLSYDIGCVFLICCSFTIHTRPWLFFFLFLSQ